MSDGPPPLERVEHSDLDGSRRPGDRVRRAPHVVALALGVAAAAVGFYVEHVLGQPLPVAGDIEPMDWLLAVSLLAIASAVGSLVRRPRAARRYARRLRRRPTALASGIVVAGFFAVGLLGPLFVSEPTRIAFDRAHQPPVWSSVDIDAVLSSCVGEVSGGQCQGTWKHPLGTTRAGRDVFAFVVLGTRTAVEIAAVSVVFLVPVGVGIGLVSAGVGGRVDEALMGLADALQTVPAVIVYILFWNWNVEYRLLMLVFVFGLVNWGGLARAVRNESLELREEPFVRAANTTGASRVTVVRRHVLPNVARPVLATVAVQVPLLVLTEVALSFVQFPTLTGVATLGDPTVVSWGLLLYQGIRVEGLYPAWWTTAMPLASVVLFALSLAVFGRALNDVLDPRPAQ